MAKDNWDEEFKQWKLRKEIAKSPPKDHDLFNYPDKSSHNPNYPNNNPAHHDTSSSSNNPKSNNPNYHNNNSSHNPSNLAVCRR